MKPALRSPCAPRAPRGPRIPCARAAATLAAGLIAAPALLGASRPLSRPELAVTLTDGHQAVRSGDVLTYTVTVRDTGGPGAPRVKVTETLSPGLAFVSASDHGTPASSHVSWSAGLTAGATRTFRVTAKVTRPPATLHSLAAVACVTLPGSTHPAVCAAHLDRLPAVATGGRLARSWVKPLACAAGGLALAGLGLLSVVAVRRGRYRPRRRRPA